MEVLLKGAQAILQTLQAGGLDTIFTNPGTSEMASVRALDDVPDMRGVLALFEGVATGAADGYARMAGRPAATLLHLGPGLANGASNLHNARRARSPIVNLVGEHARDHLAFDAPLTTDLEGVARPFSVWQRTIAEPATAGRDAAEALAAAQEREGPVTLMLPADVAWSEGASPHAPIVPRPPPQPSQNVIDQAAALIRSKGPRVLLLLGGHALGERGVAAAARLAAATGARLACETFNRRVARGAGRPHIPKIPYFGAMAEEFLRGVEVLVLVGARAPVNFFGYPGRRGTPVPPDLEVLAVARPDEDALYAIEALAGLLAGGAAASPQHAALPGRPNGPIHAASLAAAVARQLPEGAVLCDEAITAGMGLADALAAAAPHDQLDVTGGSIGGGLPLATGAAIATPDRRVWCLEGDGSAMYTIQALWTQARERLDVTTVICANRRYAILAHEHQQIEGIPPGPRALPVLSLDRPTLGFVDLARGLGVEALSVATAEELDAALARAARHRGPLLIEAVFADRAAAPGGGV
jgi:acetolactate synthase-1/2/3 large subunit